MQNVLAMLTNTNSGFESKKKKEKNVAKLLKSIDIL